MGGVDNNMGSAEAGMSEQSPQGKVDPSRRKQLPFGKHLPVKDAGELWNKKDDDVCRVFDNLYEERSIDEVKEDIETLERVFQQEPVKTKQRPLNIDSVISDTSSIASTAASDAPLEATPIQCEDARGKGRPNLYEECSREEVTQQEPVKKQKRPMAKGMSKTGPSQWACKVIKPPTISPDFSSSWIDDLHARGSSGVSIVVERNCAHFVRTEGAC